MQRMWIVKARLIPIIIGPLESFQNHSDSTRANAPGKHEIKELQKKNHIWHCTHTAESANVKVQNLFHRGNNIACSTNCKYRTAAILYTLETWFVIGV